MSATPEHPTQHELRDFVTAEDEGSGDEAVRAHLLKGCLHCLRALRGLVAELQERRPKRPLKASRGSAEELVERLRRLERRSERQVFLIDAERRAAEGLQRELLFLPAEDRRDVVRSEKRYRFYALAEALTKAAREATFSDLLQAVELAELAREVADSLDRRGYPPGLVVDALALAWGALGNARRAGAELKEAETALWTARELAAQGSQDRSVRAEILSLTGSLRTDQARFDEAVAVLEKAAELYRADGHADLEGKVLMKLGNAAGYAGDAERAVVLLRQAREKLGWEAPDHLPLMAAQSLMVWLLEVGRAAETRQILEEIEGASRGRELSFYLHQQIAWAAARLAWLEGEPERAERELRAVRDRYAESGQPYRFALASLDLTGLLLEQGRTAEVRELAHEMLPVFESRQVHNHAIAALVRFQLAAEAERATVTFVAHLSRYLRHAENNPDLSYEPLAAA